MIKQEKLGYLLRSFERQGKNRAEGETDLQFIQRIVDEKVAEVRLQFLRNQIQIQRSIETPQEQVDVNDL